MLRQRAEKGQVEDVAAVGVDGVWRRFRVTWDLPLNASHPEVRVGFLDVWEPNAEDDGKRRLGSANGKATGVF